MISSWWFSYLMGAILSFLVYTVTDILVNNSKYALWIKSEIFNRKPFNCSMCLNFWTTLGVSILWGLLGLWKIGLVQLIFGLLYTLMIYVNNKY